MPDGGREAGPLETDRRQFLGSGPDSSGSGGGRGQPGEFFRCSPVPRDAEGDSRRGHRVFQGGAPGRRSLGRGAQRGQFSGRRPAGDRPGRRGIAGGQLLACRSGSRQFRTGPLWLADLERRGSVADHRPGLDDPPGTRLDWPGHTRAIRSTNSRVVPEGQRRGAGLDRDVWYPPGTHGRLGHVFHRLWCRGGIVCRSAAQHVAEARGPLLARPSTLDRGQRPDWPGRRTGVPGLGPRAAVCHPGHSVGRLDGLADRLGQASRGGGQDAHGPIGDADVALEPRRVPLQRKLEARRGDRGGRSCAGRFHRLAPQQDEVPRGAADID